MADNLKVNAKTKILTFKKKHNLLVDSVPQKNSDGKYKIFEDIVDKDGHNRFIEGDITMETISGVTQKLGKWSLSGTHLLIVLAGNIEANVTLSPGVTWANINLPQWIKDKIYPMTGSFVARNQIIFFDDSLNTQDSYFNLNKNVSTGAISIIKVGTNNITTAKSFRIAFDLLIDNDETE